MEKEPRFQEIIESSRDRIYRICCGYVRDPDERNDVFQEVLINIWRGLDRFRGDARVETWVYTIAVNTCLSHTRSEQRRRKHIDQDSSARLDLLPEPALDEGQRDLEESAAFLYDCIATLSPIDRAVVALYLEDISSQESANILGISETNVRVKLHRIRKHLKSLMKEIGYGT